MRTNATTQMKARADSLAQMHAIQQFVQTYVARLDFAEASSRCLPLDHRQLFTSNDMAARREWSSSLKRDARKAVQSQLDLAEKLGSTRRVAGAPRLEVFDGLMRDFPHSEEVTLHLQHSTALCRMGRSQRLRLPTVMLAGDPGLARRLTRKKWLVCCAYLLRKGPEAKAAVLFQNTCEIGTHFGPKGCPAHVWKQRDAFYLKLKNLK